MIAYDSAPFDLRQIVPAQILVDERKIIVSVASAASLAG